MADITSTGNVAGVGIGAALGATVLVVGAAAFMPAVVIGGVALGITTGIGAAIGAVGGYFATKPSPQQMAQLLQQPHVQALMR